ncbi:CBS domain-containing protein [Solimonas soli]|uniref:CBS domain-containing protein n=1 Tax=Solimonas soli TaxID=413479 RepID=UPI0004B67913|nr:CBS domain-containing protein [Solimonas soli]
MKVAEVMNHRLVSVPPQTPMLDALRLMLDEKLSGLPVIDASGALVGIVSEGDFMHRAELDTERRHPRWLRLLLGPGRLAAEYVGEHARRVEEVMTREVYSIAEDGELADAVALMERHRIKRLPVTKDGRVTGMLSRADLLRALLSAGSAPAKTVDDDAVALRQRIVERIARQSWGPSATVSVNVRDGTVDLHGVLYDDRVRDALCVMVENEPGVQRVRDHLTTIEPNTGTVVRMPPGLAA